MTIAEQLAAKGFEALAGNRRLIVGLGNGALVSAVDQAGVKYSLVLVDGELTVFPAPKQQLARMSNAPFYVKKINVRGH